MKLMAMRFVISLCFLYCILAVVLRFLLPYWLSIFQDLQVDESDKVHTAIKVSEALEGMGLLHIPVIAGIGIGAVICLFVLRIIPRRRS